MLLSLAVVLVWPAAVHATPCSEQIAKLESAGNDIVPFARQSVGAQLHRQPTPGSVQNAAAEAKKQLGEMLAAARKLDSEGKSAECMATLEKAGLLLNPQ